eukprot:gene9359-11493_t
MLLDSNQQLFIYKLDIQIRKDTLDLYKLFFNQLSSSIWSSLGNLEELFITIESLSNSDDLIKEVKFPILKCGSIPSTVTGLTIIMLTYITDQFNYNGVIEEGSIPDSVTTLLIDHRLIKNDPSRLVPSSVKNLTLSNWNNNDREFDSIPPWITTLILMNVMQEKFTPGCFPSSITNLEIISGVPMIPNLFPNSIKKLEFKTYQQLIPGVIPNSVETLCFSSYWNQSIDCDIIPERVRSLNINNFRVVDFPGPLPSGLKHLQVTSYKDQNYRSVCPGLTTLSIKTRGQTTNIFPSTLTFLDTDITRITIEKLKFSGDYKHKSIGKGVLPSKLKVLDFSKCTNELPFDPKSIYIPNSVQIVKMLIYSSSVLKSGCIETIIKLFKKSKSRLQIHISECISWSTINKVKGKTPTKRYKHTACVYKDQIIFIGGQETDTKRFNEVIYYNPKSNSFQKPSVKGLVPKFSRHTARIIGSKIYMFGGYNGNGTYFGLSIYDIESREWTNVAFDDLKGSSEIPQPRTNHASAVIGDQLYIFGGNRIEPNGDYNVMNDFFCLDTKTLCWRRIEATGAIPCGRGGHSMEVIKGQIYLFGGGIWNPQSDWVSKFNDIHIFDPETNHWTKPTIHGQIPPTSTFTVSFIYGKYLMLFGGGCPQTNNVTNQIYALETESMTWTQLSCSQDPKPRDMATASVIDDQVYIFGGFAGGALQTFDKVKFNLIK